MQGAAFSVFHEENQPGFRGVGEKHLKNRHFQWIVQTTGYEVLDLDGGSENREEGASMDDTVREGLTELGDRGKCQE